MKIPNKFVSLLAMIWIVAAGLPLRAEEPPGKPLQPGEFTAEINGLKMWYKVSGTGPICLMPTPAWGPSSDLYFRTLKAMEKTFTVVYIDSRGTGRSGRASSDKEYTWNDLTADLEGLRGHLGQERVWLMGHSAGGAQVLHYACSHPERVNGLVLLSTLAVADQAWDADTDKRMALRQTQPWYAEAVKAMQAVHKTDEEFAQQLKLALPLYWSDPKKIEKFAADFAATSASVAASEGSRGSKRFPFDLRPQLKKLRAPALIVVGDDDFICSPEQARRMHLALPNSKLLLIEKCGHFPWMEQPETFEAQVPAFLEALGLHTN